MPHSIALGARAHPRPSGRTSIGGGGLESQIRKQLQGLTASPFAPQFEPIDVNQEVPFLSDLNAAIESIRGRETATTAGELQGLEGLFDAADPTLRLQKAQEFINTIVGPQQEAAAIKAGFGRGPAALEATTKAGAALALPIVTESGRQQALANQFKVALEQARLSRGESKDRAVFEAVLNKVGKGQTTAQLNLQRRGLQSEQQVARANIGLGTQDRTLALLNQLRQIRTSQASLNANPATGGVISGGRVGTGSIFPGGFTRSTGLPSFTTPESRAVRSAGITSQRNLLATQAAARDTRLAANPLSSFGGLSSGLSSSGGVIKSRSAALPTNLQFPGAVL